MNALAISTIVAAIGGSILCPICDSALADQGHSASALSAQTADTSTVKLHISGMTCGTCPTTARAALKKLPGVYSASVILDDSLGVVRYDARKVTPLQIAAHLTRLTGYAARVIVDSAKAPQPGGK